MMVNDNGSNSAVVMIAQSKSRYKHQELLLFGFKDNPGFTAKEVAVECFDWKYEGYSDSPKRARDLSSNHLAYLEQLPNRKCRRSGKSAHTYRITARGLAFLRRKGMASKDFFVAPEPSVLPVKTNKPDFKTMKSGLA